MAAELLLKNIPPVNRLIDPNQVQARPQDATHILCLLCNPEPVAAGVYSSHGPRFLGSKSAKCSPLRPLAAKSGDLELLCFASPASRRSPEQPGQGPEFRLRAHNGRTPALTCSGQFCRFATCNLPARLHAQRASPTPPFQTWVKEAAQAATGLAPSEVDPANSQS